MPTANKTWHVRKYGLASICLIFGPLYQAFHFFSFSFSEVATNNVDEDHVADPVDRQAHLCVST